MMHFAVRVDSEDYGEDTGFLASTAREIPDWTAYKPRGSVVPIDMRHDYGVPHQHAAARLLFSPSQLHVRWSKGTPLDDEVKTQVVSAIITISQAAAATTTGRASSSSSS